MNESNSRLMERGWRVMEKVAMASEQRHWTFDLNLKQSLPAAQREMMIFVVP